MTDFPHRVEVSNPNQRVKYETLDEQLIDYIKSSTVCYNPLIKDYKKNIANLWCNMMFGPEAWHFEDSSHWPDGVEPFQYWVCFKDPEHATLFALMWS